MDKHSVLFLRFNSLSGDSRLLKEVEAVSEITQDITVLCLSKSKERHFKFRSTEFNVRSIKDRREGGKISKLVNLVFFNLYACVYIAFFHNKFDTIHFADLETAALPFWLAKLFQIHTIYDIYDYYADTRDFRRTLRSLIIKYDTSIINRADCVIVCSDERIEQIQPGIPKKLEIVYNSPEELEQPLIDSDQHHDDKLVSIVYIGGLWPYRLIEELIDVVQKDSTLRLIIGGTGQLQQTVEDAAEANSRIEYLGEVPYADVSSIESSADLMVALYDPVIKNHVYASPNKFFEAFMLGKPLVMVKGSGMSEWVSHQNVGVLVSTSTESLHNGISRLVSEKDEWPSMSIRMKEEYRKNFDWSEMTKRLVKIYSELS